MLVDSALNRLCDAVLDWQVLDDLTSKRGSSHANTHRNNNALSLKVPHNLEKKNFFSTFEEYLSYWEPLLLLDLKASVVQSTELMKSKNVRGGVVHACEAESIEGRAGTIRMNLTFNRAMNANGETMNGPGNMDLVLISTAPNVLPLSQTTSTLSSSGEYMLALVTNGSGTGRDGALQAKADANRWQQLKEVLEHEDRRVSAMKGVATKNAKKSAAAAVAAHSEGSSSLQQIQQFSENGRMASVAMKGIQRDASSSAVLAASGGSRFSGAKEKERRVSNITKVAGTTSYQLHYVVLDRVTSAWREFMALCELPSGTSLLDEILGERREMEMESTPPQPTDGPSPFVSDRIARRESGVSTGGKSTGSSTDGRKRRSRTLSESEGDSAPDGGLVFSPTFVEGRNVNINDDGNDAGIEEGWIKTPECPPLPPGHEGNVDGTWAEAGISIADNDANVQRKRSRHQRSNSGDSTCDGDGSTLFVKDIPGVSTGYMGMLRSTFNQSQLLAVVDATTAKRGFTLIQGPPGTGKTSTVVGILNTLHIRAYDDYYEDVIRTVTGPEGIRCRTGGLDAGKWLGLVAGLSKRKPHILVVAPSNVAVDNIIQRIMEKGFCDSKESTYSPNMLRVGSSGGGGASNSAEASVGSSSVKAVSLEELVEKEQLSAMSEESRASAMDSVAIGMRDVIAQLWSVQAALLNMAKAFEEYPLPKGWELRCEQESGRPYWVDHKSQRVHMDAPKEEHYQHRPTTPPGPPPPLPPSGEGSKPESSSSRSKVVVDLTKVKFEDDEDLFGDSDEQKLKDSRLLSSHTLRTLPEYAIYCNRIVQIVEQVDRLALFSARCKARMNFSMHGGMQSARQSIEASIIDGAHLVFTTLNSAGHPCLEGSKFSCLVIDEAAQCVEPSSLIPLHRGVENCIMVGDPMQLPATILSDEAKHRGYDRSMFERLIVSGHPYTMLNVQYRMAPSIAAFPSRAFYHGNLRNGTNVRADNYCPSYIGSGNVRRAVVEAGCMLKDHPSAATSAATVATEESFASHVQKYAASKHQSRTVPQHSYNSYTGPALLSSSMFFDVKSREADLSSASKSNPAEAAFCIHLLKVLVKEAFRLNRGKLGSIGIITPYSEQLTLLRAMCKECRLVSGNKLALLPFMENSTVGTSGGGSGGSVLDIELNTVDAFQGREKDLIIISTVRSNDHGAIGFVSDKRRMNVALSRAKFGLFVVGNASTLRTNKNWGHFIKHMEDEKELIQANEDTDLLCCLQDSYSFEPDEAKDDGDTAAAKRRRT
jgi:hypothetical protein